MNGRNKHEGGEDTLGIWRGLGVGITLGVVMWLAVLGLIWYFL